MAFVLPTIHPRQLIRGAFAAALKEQPTLAGENVFPNRLEFYDLEKMEPPFIGVYCLNEQVISPLTSPPIFRRAMTVYLDCWQTPQKDTEDINTELDLLAAQVEAVINNGRNRIRELAAAVEWRKAPAYEGTEISLIADEACIHYTSQALEFSVQYEWRPEIDVSGLDSFKLLENVWKFAPAPTDQPNLLSRITLHKEADA